MKKSSNETVHNPITEKVRLDQLNALKRIDIKTFQPFIIVIVNTIVIILTVFAFVLPQYTKFQHIRNSYASKNEMLKKVKANAEYLQGLYGLSVELENNILVARDALPTQDNTPDFLNMLLQIAQNSGVEVKSLSLSGITEPGKKSNVGVVGTSVRIAAPYDSVLQFLLALENSRRIVNIEDLQVSIADDGTYILSLNISGYYLPEVDKKGLGLDVMSKKRPLENIITKLFQMDEYDAGDVKINIEKISPFTAGQEVKVGVDVITGEKVNTDTTNESTGLSN